MFFSLAGRTALAAVVALLQSTPTIPPPRGLVNDFANVLDAASSARIERIAQVVRDGTKGEIAVVTLADLGGREASDVALRIGREWKVGNLAEIGDRTRNAGVVILIVPKETSSDGRGHCRVLTGQGTEGFITDATSGDICREATASFRQRDYSAGVELVTTRVAQRFAQEFNVSLDSGLAGVAPTAVPVRRGRQGESRGINPLVLLLVLFVVLSLLGGRRRRGCFPMFLPFGGFGGGGFGGGGGGGFGGGGGGGFGGFGGGGGFSGGGGGSDW